MIAGAALIITGIALACINHQVTISLGSVCLSLGAPILLIGLIMTIVRKCQDNQRPQTQQPTQTKATRGYQYVTPGKGQRLGSTPRDPYNTQERRHDQKLRRWWQFC